MKNKNVQPIKSGTPDYISGSRSNDELPQAKVKYTTRGPCKNCQKREVGCHSKCADYLSYVAYREIVRSEKLKNVELFYRQKSPNI